MTKRRSARPRPSSSPAGPVGRTVGACHESFARVPRDYLRRQQFLPNRPFRLLSPRAAARWHALYALHARHRRFGRDEPWSRRRRNGSSLAWRRSPTARSGEFTHPTHPSADRLRLRRFLVISTAVPVRRHSTARKLTAERSARMANFAELYPYFVTASRRRWGWRASACGVRGPTRPTPTPTRGGWSASRSSSRTSCRDLGEDLSRDRVYLPADRTRAFECLPERSA